MGLATDFADKLWAGEQSTTEQHPFTTLLGIDEVRPDLAFVSSFANVTAVKTDDGLVLVDTGSGPLARHNFDQLREWSKDRVHTAVYTHGHIDHAFGLFPFEEEAKSEGWEKTRVIGHEAVGARFDRYRMTVGYNTIINRRQFQMGVQWPTDYRYPDETLRKDLDVEVGGVSFELHHDKGETDDHVWVWMPQQKALCTGDLFIWASPNCGNPQKQQRYPKEWAAALRKMAALGPEVLLPGHGPPIVGADRVRLALEETAELLETLLEQTLKLMNDGARLNDVLHTVTAPPRLLERPYLRPIYDEPEFIVRGIWRLYGGWHDGNPANLKPAADGDLARELAELAGGAARLADRAEKLVADGNLAVACHLVELATHAAPDDRAIHAIRAAVYKRRAEAATSTMARGVFSGAARESEDKGGQ